jgi:hypothetical protein
MSVKNPLGLVLYCYLNMLTINKTYLILSYLKYQELHMLAIPNNSGAHELIPDFFMGRVAHL